MEKRKYDFPTISSILRTAGLGPKTSAQLATLMVGWMKSNGPQWTIDRFKALRSWVITFFAGAPKPAPWMAHTKGNLPKDTLLRSIFTLPLPNAIMVCSIDTLIPTLREASQSQIDKFVNAVECPKQTPYKLEPGGLDRVPTLEETVSKCGVHRRHYFDPMRVPTLSDINSKSIALKDGSRRLIKPTDMGARASAYVASWKAIPKETIEFLGEIGHLDWIPIDAIGNKYQLDLNNSGSSTIGVIAFLQQEEYKLRAVANGNKIVQSTLKPLGKMWYDQVRSNPHDSTFDVEKGIKWVQDQLKAGITLAGVDMTSATDLLDLDLCIDLVNQFYFSDLRDSDLYDSYLRYFKALSRGSWYSEDLKRCVRWKQGQPLGLYPSFALLTLTNYALASWACVVAGVEPDSFFCHGDDMIINAKAMDVYCALVRALGGEINLSKTLVSNKIAEFDGKLITAEHWCNKRMYLTHCDDDSFLSFARWFGPKVRKYLSPRQRRVWDELKFVPGIIYGDTFMCDSFGEPLEKRVEWWETWKSHLTPGQDKEIPPTFGETLWKVALTLGLDEELRDTLLPYPLEDWTYQVQDSDALEHGDPRKWRYHGHTLLQICEAWIRDPRWVPYAEFLGASCAP